MTIYFRGFSTVDRNQRTNKLYDVELIKRDLLNHFHTRLSERIMYPNFGSIIWDLLFEPFTDATKELVIEDAVRIVSSDRRVTLQDILVEEYEYGLRLQIDLFYRPINEVGSFSVDFDNRLVERV